MFRINRETKASQPVEEVEFSMLGLKERDDIQEWIAASPSILGEDLLIISKEFSGFDRTNERLDLLAVERSGKLVVIELKRDDSGADVHWQAIKYASYLHRADPADIIRLFAEYRRVSGEEARSVLEEYLDQDDLATLNSDQRIILASHRFAPEVTSAVLWLNEKIGKHLITCVKLTPFRDTENDSLYLQVNTIIPVPGTEKYLVGIGSVPTETAHGGPSRQREYEEVKEFFAKVESIAASRLSPDLRPNKMRKFGRWRWASMWYSRQPWGYDKMFYAVTLGSSVPITAMVGFVYNRNGLGQDELDHVDGIRPDLRRRLIRHEDREEVSWWRDPYTTLAVGRDGASLGDEFALTVAEILARFIEAATPVVDGYFKGNDRVGTS